METFKDFGIKVETKAFSGDKIKISRILNRKIAVYGFEIKDSKVNSGKCLCLQIELDKTKYVVFTGSVVLTSQIQQVPRFPFETTIIQESERYEFT